MIETLTWPPCQQCATEDDEFCYPVTVHDPQPSFSRTPVNSLMVLIKGLFIHIAHPPV